MAERFTAWISKYALTEGVFSDEVEDRFDISPTMVSSTTKSSAYYQNGAWHRTREEAVEKAEKMRLARIAALKKQIKRLATLSFAEEL